MDRRAYLRTIGAAGLASGLAGCLGELGGGSDEITPATAPGFPPFEMVEDGELVGFDVDLLEAVVAETDFELGEWEQLEFDSLIPALTSENIDVIAAAMTITAERDETIDFSDPYYSSDQSIVVREGEGGQYSSLSDLSSVDAVGAQSGTTGEGVVQDELIANGHVAEGDYRAFDNYVLAVQSLENGDVDAVVIDEPVGNTFADQRAVEVAFVYETGEEFGFGVRDGDEDLQTGLNDGLAAVRQGGQYGQITSKWFGQG